MRRAQIRMRHPDLPGRVIVAIDAAQALVHAASGWVPVVERRPAPPVETRTRSTTTRTRGASRPKTTRSTR